MENGESMSFWKANRTRLITVLLVVSVPLNIAGFAVIQPRLETTINDMRAKAFESWLTDMFLIGYLLDHAETNFDLDFPRALASHLGQKDDIFTIGTSSSHPEGLYANMSSAVYRLYNGLSEAYAGNQTGRIFEQQLDPNVVVIVRDIAQAVLSLYDKNRDVLKANGVDPIRQLSVAGVLSEFEDYLQQINQLSVELYLYEYS